MPHPHATAPAFSLIILFLAIPGPAIACLCDCDKDAAVSLDGYDQVFAGLTIWTEHAGPLPARAPHPGGVALDPGYWIESQVLVLRKWRGNPAIVANVWTPVVTSCDQPPIPGTYFTALVTYENGRRVARSTLCDCNLTAAEKTGRGSLALAGVSIVSAAIALAAVSLIALFRTLRRRRVPG